MQRVVGAAQTVVRADVRGFCHRAARQLGQADLALRDVGQRSKTGRRRRNREPDLHIDDIRAEPVISAVGRTTDRPAALADPCRDLGYGAVERGREV